MSMLRGDDIFEAERCWPIRIVSSQSKRDNSSRALTADPKSECLMHVVRSLRNIIGCKSVPSPDPTIPPPQLDDARKIQLLEKISSRNSVATKFLRTE
jgi:hypothetical protein